jgi:hypothetical protein
MDDPVKRFSELPGRLLLDTCILNLLQDEDEYLWEGILPENILEEALDPDLRALRNIFIVNERASFQLVISPLTIAEVANVQDFGARERKVRWVLDVLDTWLITVDDLMDREGQGGTVRTRFKLTPNLQLLESQLMTIKDFQRDPFDRLLLLQYQMANCDAFLTVDINTIWKHRKELGNLGIRVIKPSEFWDLIQPWARLWM